MAGRGRPKRVLELSDDERAELERWSRRGRGERLASRARIVLACAAGAPNTEVARTLGVSVATVGKWRTRFLADRLAGLADRPRPGRPPVLDGKRLNDAVVAPLHAAPPDGSARWSTRQMAAAAGVSQSTVSRVWRTAGVEPHRAEPWSASTKEAHGDRAPASPRPAPAPSPPSEHDDKAPLLAALDTAGAKLMNSIESRPRGRRLLRKLDGELTARHLKRRPRKSGR